MIDESFYKMNLHEETVKLDVSTKELFHSLENIESYLNEETKNLDDRKKLIDIADRLQNISEVLHDMVIDTYYK